MRYLVDGMNVVGSRPDGWWRDRPGARRALVAQLATLADGDEVAVVFDGRPQPGEVEAAGDVHVTAHFAPGGPDAADDCIVSTVEADTDPATLVVVTSDSTLADRVRSLGAGVVGAGTFRRRLDG